MRRPLLLLAAVGCVLSTPLQDYGDEEKCGYESCHKTDPHMLNVHIVAHTHDDVGWLKTVDQYYYGSRNNIQKAGVQYILDSVIKELWEDSKRRFIYVETAFFWKWWVRQSPSVQSKVHTLVRQGRLQFVGGAWSMNDEANVHYQTTIDQFTWGLSKLNATFGECGRPHVAWQIDPFGHSREFASLCAMMGYDGLFLGRIDHQDKYARKEHKRMEVLLRGDDVLGKPSDIFTGVLYNTYSPPAGFCFVTMNQCVTEGDNNSKPSDIFTGVLYNTYSPPPGFCFDVLCDDEPIIDDPDSPMYNVEDKIGLFLSYARSQSRYFRHNNVLFTMGGDFTYQDATMWYKNLDKLIKYSNLKAAKDGLNITLFYSTPACYLKAVKDADPILPTKEDDYFPYSSDPTAFWTGYFTSRPTTKYFEREGNNYLQMVKQLQVLANLEPHNEFVINELKSAMGVMQHHDAITGTEKQHVTHDYERLLNQAIDDALIVAKQAFNKLTNGTKKPPVFDYHRCRLNESSCDVSENSDKFVVTLYNPLAWSVTDVFRIPVIGTNFEVYGPDGKKIETQFVTIPKDVIAIPTRISQATHEIVLKLELKPLSYITLYVKKISKKVSKRSAKDYDFYELWKTAKDKPIIDDLNEDLLKKYNVNKRYSHENYPLFHNNFDFVKNSAENDKANDVLIKNSQVNYDNDKNDRSDDDLYKNDAEKSIASDETSKNTIKNKKSEQEPIEILIQRENDAKIKQDDDLINRRYEQYIKSDEFLTKSDEFLTKGDEKIPLPPTVLEKPTVFDEMSYDILKGGKTGDVEELKKYIRESRRRVEKERDRIKVEYPNLNDEEMRMLSDDPRIVDVFDDQMIWENKFYNLHIDKNFGLKSITIPNIDSIIDINLKMSYYTGCVGNNTDPSTRASGAYIFRPSIFDPIDLKVVNSRHIDGAIVKEFRQTLSNNAYLNMKVYNSLPFIDLEWVVGPINIDDELGKEFIVKYDTQLITNGEFYTDSNGRQMLKRKLNYRPDWNVTLTEPVAGNYYPVVSQIAIEDTDWRVTVLPDRPQGGSSLREGSIELMVHRRLLHDDAFGVGEALNETANGVGLVVRGNHRIILEKDKDKVRKDSINYYQKPVVLFAESGVSLKDWLKMDNENSFVDRSLPFGLHLLSLESWEDKLLIRLENYLEESGNTVEVDLGLLFKNIDIKNVKETLLSANVWRGDHKKWEWRVEKEFGREKGGVLNRDLNSVKVKIAPKEIRTFIVDYDLK